MINLCIAIVKEILFYQTTDSLSPFGVKTNRYHQVLLFYKGLILILDYINQDAIVTKEINSIVHLLCSLSLLYILYIKLPFLKFKMLKAFIVITSVLVSMSIVLFIHAFTMDSTLLNGLQIVLLLLPVLTTKTLLSVFQALFERIIRFKSRSAYHAIHYTLLLEEVTFDDGETCSNDKSLFPNNSLIYGILSKFDIQLLNIVNTRRDRDSDINICSLAIERLEYALNSHPKSQPLLLFMAHVYIDKLKNILKAVELIKRLDTLNPSISIRSSTEHFYSRLKDVFGREVSTSSSQLEITSYFENINLLEVLKTNVLSEIQNHIDLWSELGANAVEAYKVIAKAKNIEKTSIKIKSHYNKNKEDFRLNFGLPILLYAVYLNSVRGMSQEGANTLNKFQGTIQNKLKKSDFDVSNGKQAVVIVSLDKRKLGEILYASGSVQNLFNLKKKELIGEYFGMLFPNVIAKAYRRFIQKFIKLPNIDLNYPHLSFGRTFDGEFFEAEVNFQLYPYMDRDITLIVLLRQMSVPQPMLIAKYDGTIATYSMSLEKAFNKENTSMKAYQSIQDISSDFDQINEAFNYIYSSMEVFQQPSDLTLEDRRSKRNELFSENDDLHKLRPKQTFESIPHGRIVLARPMSEENQPLNLNSKESYRFLFDQPYSPRSALKLGNIALDLKEHKPEVHMTIEEAQAICDEYTEGKHMIFNPLNTGSASTKKRRAKLMADVQIRPFRLESMVCKIIVMKNVQKEATPFQIIAPLETAKIKDRSRIVSEFVEEIPAEVGPVEVSTAKSGDNLQNRRGVMKKTIWLFQKEKAAAIPESCSSINTMMKIPHLRRKSKRRTHPTEKLQQEQDYYKQQETVKTMNSVFSKRKINPSLKSILIGIQLIIFVMLACSGINLLFSRKSINEVAKSINIVNLAALRLENTIKIWQFSLFLFAASSGMATFPPPFIQLSQVSLKDDLKLLVDANNQLKEELSMLQEESLVKDAFAKNIKIWNFLGPSYQDFDTFTAHDMLVTKYMQVLSSGVPSIVNINNLITTFNNTANDFMLSNQVIITKTQQYMETTIQSNINSLQIILTVEVLAAICVSLGFFFSVVIVLRSHKKLFKALVKISESHIMVRIAHMNRIKALFEEEVESRVFIKNAVNTFEEYEVREDAKIEKNNDTFAKNHSYRYRKLILNLLKYISIGLIFIPLLIGLYSVTLVGSIDNFMTFREVANQVSVLSQASYQADMLIGAFAYQGFFLSYSDMLIYNGPPINQVNTALEELKGLGTKLSSLFLNKEGKKVNPILESVLKNDVCQYIPEYADDCQIATKNGKLGLLSINDDYVQTASIYLDLFKQNPTFATVKALALPLAASVTIWADCSEEYLSLFNRLCAG